MKAIEILNYFCAEQMVTESTPFEIADYDNAIQELEELNIDKNLSQELFIKQELKYKKEIKELKIKFIEDIAFLKKEM